MTNKINIILSEEDWIEVIKLVEAKSEGGWTSRNKYDDIKDMMLWQLGASKR